MVPSMGTAPRFDAGECLVIEDSVGGVWGARAAGMKCLAISNTYPHEQLAGAAASRVAPRCRAWIWTASKALFEDNP